MRKFKHPVLMVLLGLFVAVAVLITILYLTANRYTSTFSPEHATSRQQEIDSVIHDFVDNEQFNGTVLVAVGDEIIFEEGYGYAKRYFGRTPNTADTKFLIGSMTKSFTAAAILSMEKKGLLSLDDKVVKYFPEYTLWADITVQQLLNHTSGIKNYYESPGDFVKYYMGHKTPAEILDAVKETPLNFESGMDYEYSNTNYILLSAMIEKVTGKSYIDYLNTNLFEPMGLADTGYEEYPDRIDGMANGYCAGMFIETAGFNLSNFYGAGGLYSSAEDIYRFISQLDMQSQMRNKSMNEFQDIYFYGNGMLLENHPTLGEIFSHTGGGPGISTGMYDFADQDVIVVILNNNTEFMTDNMAVKICEVVNQ